ncbi:addiction module protein, partial [Candidatus Aerophobetes bacterium]
MYKIPFLPLQQNLETKDILKKLTHAHRALAELKGVSLIIPNQSILINTLALKEAKDSSAIENIIISDDELYKSDCSNKYFATRGVKEVYNYVAALKHGYSRVKTYGLLTNSHILEIQATIEENTAGFRSLPGTLLKNDHSGEVIYTPPQCAKEITDLMDNLEKYINENTENDFDPLTKMAIIHHQFESIHPFYDGNGRTGRIINVLYLLKNDLLDTPVLYLSRYINENKNEYYRLLQEVRVQKGAWNEWILFILEAVIQTSY